VRGSQNRAEQQRREEAEARRIHVVQPRLRGCIVCCVDLLPHNQPHNHLINRIEPSSLSQEQAKQGEENGGRSSTAAAAAASTSTDKGTKSNVKSKGKGKLGATAAAPAAAPAAAIGSDGSLPLPAPFDCRPPQHQRQQHQRQQHQALCL